MTFAQLRAFATVARLGSVTEAATSLGVSEPAVSAQVAALRRDLHDALFVRAGSGIRLTPGGERLAAAAAEMLALEDRARREVGEAERPLLRLAVTAPVAEVVSAPLLDAFTRRRPNLEVAQEIAPPSSFAALLADRRADVVLGTAVARDSVPFLRCRLVVVAAPGGVPDRWLAGPGGEERLRRFLRRPADVRVFPSEASAVEAASEGQGAMLAIAHTVVEPLRRGTLVRLEARPAEEIWFASALEGERRSPAAASLLAYITTPEATHAMIARPGGVAAGRFRPPVYVTIWSGR
ncbi:MAG TPA: LysR family transcriptional regulator [Solirubrobacteraceae bacterium]|nr:LysR family transcriptional regulator [Solirubrobacteraceae bacterium]